MVEHQQVRDVRWEYKVAFLKRIIGGSRSSADK